MKSANIGFTLFVVACVFVSGATLGAGAHPPVGSSAFDQDTTRTESEPNDGRTEANPLAVGETVQAEASTTTDADYYALDLNGGETLAITLSRSGGDGALIYGIMHPTGDILDVATANADETAVIGTSANQSGTYYIIVFPQQEDPGTGQYQLSVSSSLLNPIEGTTEPAETTRVGDSNEPNNDYQNATLLQSGTPVQGAVDGATDQDWYEIDLSQGSTIQANLMHTGGDGFLQITYFHANGTVMETMTAEGENSTAQLITSAAESGRYWAVVQSNSTAQYQFTITETETGSETSAPGGTVDESDSNEPNDNVSTATRIRPGEELDGVISSVTDIDGFAFEAQGGETLTVNLTNWGDQNAALDVTVLAPDGTPILVNELPTFTTRPGRIGQITIPDLAQSGNYYIVVTAGNGTGSYSLSMDLTTDSGSDGSIFEERGFRHSSDTNGGATSYRTDSAAMICRR